MEQAMTLAARIDALEAMEKAATPNWEFRGGTTREGDSCDLLMAEHGKAAAHEDVEYGEVFFDAELFGEAQVTANWAVAQGARNALPGLIAALRIAERALQCIVDGELPEDAVSDQECWDQTAGRALREMTEALNNDDVQGAK
jgi:hypothetical protein